MSDDFLRLVEKNPPPFWNHTLLDSSGASLGEAVAFREMYRDTRSLLDLATVTGVPAPYGGGTWGSAFKRVMETAGNPAVATMLADPGLFLRQGEKPVSALSLDDGITNLVLTGGEWVVVARFLVHRAGVLRGFGPMSRDIWITNLPVTQKIHALREMGFSVRLVERELTETASSPQGTRFAVKNSWQVDKWVGSDKDLLRWTPGNRWLRTLFRRNRS
jgi:hypothetical protein